MSIDSKNRLPSDKYIEAQALASMYLSDEARNFCVDNLNRDDFYSETHKIIFDLFSNFKNEKIMIDEIFETISEKIKIEKEQLKKILQSVSTTAYTRELTISLKNLSARRKLTSEALRVIDICNYNIDRLRYEDIDSAIDRLDEISISIKNFKSENKKEKINIDDEKKNEFLKKQKEQDRVIEYNEISQRLKILENRMKIIFEKIESEKIES